MMYQKTVQDVIEENRFAIDKNEEDIKYLRHNLINLENENQEREQDIEVLHRVIKINNIIIFSLLGLIVAKVFFI